MTSDRSPLSATSPLADGAPADSDDSILVARARRGERTALEDLVRRHQRWIYNIAIRMLHHPQDAEDATQEILIKALTRLSSFEYRSSFRTWLYRMVVNHLLNTKRGRVERESLTFRAYGDGLDSIPDLDLPAEGASPDTRLLVTEAMITCTSGMLLCLDREQRLTYVLGEILEVSDTVAAELLDITREGFRQRLARARRDLHNFMNDKCGLVNAANPCRCPKKTRGFIAAGYVDPKNLLFVRARVNEIRDATPSAFESIKNLDDRCASVHRGHPFYDAPDLVPMLRRVLANPEFKGRTGLV